MQTQKKKKTIPYLEVTLGRGREEPKKGKCKGKFGKTLTGEDPPIRYGALTTLTIRALYNLYSS